MMSVFFKGVARLVLVALALIAIARFVPGITIGDFYTATIISLLWGVVSLTLKPILSLLTLPINILTLGLFSVIVNALLFWFLASFISGFSVAGFIPALLGSILLSIAVWAINKIL